MSPDVDRARRMVRDYVDHLEDHGYVRQIVEPLGLAGVLGLLESMVRDGDADEVDDALLFVRDTYMLVEPPGFRTAFARSGLLTAIRDGIRSPAATVRAQCVYTLGKTCNRASGRHLEAAFGWYLTRAPRELDRLLFELAWLHGTTRPFHHYLRDMVSASSWMTRWAAVGILADRVLAGRRRPPGWARQMLRRLAGDTHPWVRREARWHLDRSYRDGPPHRGRRECLRRRAEGPPPLTFDGLDTLIGHYLSVSGETDYDETLCTAVGRHHLAHPITPGWDRAEYFGPVMASRRVAATDH